MINTDIMVFKTSVQNPGHIQQSAQWLDLIGGVLKWNFDLDDADNILRVETVNLLPRAIETALPSAGCYCEELPD